jgi:hypothetical protein
MTKSDNTPKTIPHENLLLEIELIFPIWKREIARIAADPTPSREDLYLSVKLASAMQQSYVAFCILKSDLKKQATFVPTAQILEMVDKYKNSN